MIPAVGLLVVRFGTLLRFVPFFGGRPLGLISWASITVILSWVLAPYSGSFQFTELGVAAWCLLAVKELFIGIVFGCVVRIAFAVFEIAGELARISASPVHVTTEGLFDASAPFAGMYTLLGTALFLLVGGHHSLVTGLKTTILCLPPSLPLELGVITDKNVPILLEVFGASMATGVLISAPMFVAGLCADIMVTSISRIAAGLVSSEGTPAIRSVFVQVFIVVVLSVVVSIAVGFLVKRMEMYSICS